MLRFVAVRPLNLNYKGFLRLTDFTSALTIVNFRSLFIRRFMRVVESKQKLQYSKKGFFPSIG